MGEGEGVEGGAAARVAARLAAAPRFASPPGLERMRRLAEALGHPERRLSVVHLAGTNGKGSVSAMVASILAAAGHRVALFTSPHLVGWEERIRVGGRPVGSGTLWAALEVVERADRRSRRTGERELLQSELLTAAAWWLAASAGAEWLVQETGLGGRFDPTNAVEAPRAVAWTPVGLDHTRILGRTLAAIGRDKAGIAKRGAEAVSAPQRPPVRSALEAAVAAAGGRLRLGNRDFRVKLRRLLDRFAPGDGLGGVLFDYRGPRWSLKGLQVPLAGAHQAGNAAVAVALAEALAGVGVAVDPEAVRAGLCRVAWPGRLEPFVEGGRLWVLDGAHNPHAAGALGRWLRGSGGVRATVLAIGSDKDAAGVVRALAPAGGRLLALGGRQAGFTFHPPERLLRLWHDAGGRTPLGAAASAEEALAQIRAWAAPGDRILVTGSLHLVGLFRPLLAGASGQPGAVPGEAVLAGTDGRPALPRGAGFALEDPAQLHVAQP
ncbi:MAG: bifunctional folylpolyglutamate synthase/dihydrofolate synthase [Bacillota bacterium]|nr:bifunctional folylpolyglutamate synthase/dihydrofolate synthase [Bacillota bacterium]